MADTGDFKRYITKVGPQGVSLHNHLTNTLLKIAKERPVDALNGLEDTSFQVKHKLVVPIYANLAPEIDDAKIRAEMVTAVEQISKIVSGPPVVPGEEEAEPEPEEGQVLPDIMGLANHFSWAGVNFGRTEWFKVACAVEKLVKAKVLFCS